MIVQAPSTCLNLQPGQVAHLRLRAGTRVRGLRGSTWLTTAGDLRDVVLDADDEWVIDHDRQVLACALRADGRALLQLDEAGPA